jgi:hypothetical protein
VATGVPHSPQKTTKPSHSLPHDAHFTLTTLTRAVLPGAARRRHGLHDIVKRGPDQARACGPSQTSQDAARQRAKSRATSGVAVAGRFRFAQASARASEGDESTLTPVSPTTCEARAGRAGRDEREGFERAHVGSSLTVATRRNR